MHQRIVVADAAHGHIAVGFNAATAETGAAGVEAATVDVDIAVGTHAGTGITVYGLPAGTAHGKAVAVGGERGGAAVDNDVVVAGEAAASGVGGGTVDGKTASVDDDVASCAFVYVAGLDAGAVGEVIAGLVVGRGVDYHAARGCDVKLATVHGEALVGLDAFLGVGSDLDVDVAVVHGHTAFALQSIGKGRGDAEYAGALQGESPFGVDHCLVGIAVGIGKGVGGSCHEMDECVLVFVDVDGGTARRGELHTVKAQDDRGAEFAEEQVSVGGGAAEVVHHIVECGGLRFHRHMAAGSGNLDAVVGVGIGDGNRVTVPHDAYHPRGVDADGVDGQGGVAVCDH